MSIVAHEQAHAYSSLSPVSAEAATLSAALLLSCARADQFQSVQLPETVEEVLNRGTATCAEFNPWGTLLAGRPASAGCSPMHRHDADPYVHVTDTASREALDTVELESEHWLLQLEVPWERSSSGTLRQRALPEPASHMTRQSPVWPGRGMAGMSSLLLTTAQSAPSVSLTTSRSTSAQPAPVTSPLPTLPCTSGPCRLDLPMSALPGVTAHGTHNTSLDATS